MTVNRYLSWALAASVVLSGAVLVNPASAKPKHTPPGNAAAVSARGSVHFDNDTDFDNWERAQIRWHAEHDGRFNTNDRSILRDLILGRGYYRDRLDSQTRLTLREYENLPPGIQKRLQSGKGLPPGIAKQVHYLPASANHYFGYPDYYRIGVYGNDYFLYNTRSNIITDILRNLL